MRKSNLKLVQLPLFDPVYIKTSNGYVSIIDPVDADLCELTWYGFVGQTGRVYIRRSIYDKSRKWLHLHKVILERMLLKPLNSNEVADHIDNNPLNNRRSNLRLASLSENLQNSKLSNRNKVGFKGVHYHVRDKTYNASIRVKGRLIHLGTFNNPIDAYDAYCEAAIKYFGEFARLK